MRRSQVQCEGGLRVNAGRRLLTPFLKDRSGATGVEFAMLALPFAMVTFAILESCVSFAGSQVLANATEDVARQLRTGQIKAAAINEVKLKDLLCDKLKIFSAPADCASRMIVDLREYPTFELAAAQRIVLTANRDINTAGFAVKPGKSQTKNMLRVFYRWPVITDFMRRSMSNLNDNTTLHFATVAWQNEPFDD